MGSTQSLRFSQLAILLAAIVLLAIFGMAVHTVRSYQQASGSVIVAQEMRVQVAEALAHIKDIHLGTRTYFATGDENALDGRRQSFSEFTQRMRSLDELTANYREQNQAIRQLDGLVRQLMMAYESYTELRRTQGMAAVTARFSADNETKRLGDELKAMAAALQTDETKRLEGLLRTVRGDAALTLAMLAGGLLLDVALVIAVVVTLRRDYRAREAAANALRQQSDEIKDLYNRAPCGYHSLDEDGRFVAINDTELAWLGYPRAAVIGKMRLADVVAPGSRERLAEALVRLKQSGEVRDLEVEVCRKDGTRFPGLINGSAIRDARGGFVASRAALFDLTERKRIERMQEEARTYQESIVDTVREPLVILTHDLRVNSANRSFYAKFNTSAAETVGQPFAAIHDSVWAIPTLEAALTNVVLEDREVTSFEVARQFPGLGSRVMLLNARKLHRVGNHTAMMLLAIDDITERKRMEAALQHERYLLGELMDNTTECIFFKDRKCRFTRVNHGVAERFGLNDPAEAVGKTDADFFSPEHATITLAEEEEVMRTGKPMTKEEKETWADGRVTWVLTVKLPLWDETGNMVGTFGMARDITLRKRAESQLEELNASLRVRTVELEAANRELEAFSYSVSHDLRAPLRHIDYFSGALEKHVPAEHLDAKARRYLASITSSARGMGQLIDDLLSFARVSRVELQRSRVRLDEIVAETRSSLQSEINGRSIAWEVDGLPTVEGDPALLRQVFMNVLSNAVKYTRNRPEAQIQVSTLPSATGEVLVRVRDNGAGFDMKYSDKLFGVFQRLHSNHEFEGTGVGLANVRRIVERHGGRIWAEAEVDRGATFYFTLPASSNGQ